MTESNLIREDYFDWMVSKVNNTNDPFVNKVTYNKLLKHLDSVDFTYCIPEDENREANGIELRDIFCYECDKNKETTIPELSRPCSVLEMMIALAINLEEGFAADAEFGDRTGYWFWCMINSMQLGYQDDEDFDPRYADIKINRMLERKYSKDGKGGLFHIEGIGEDMRDISIWMQAMWFLDSQNI